MLVEKLVGNGVCLGFVVLLGVGCWCVLWCVGRYDLFMTGAVSIIDVRLCVKVW